jgi:hypothetical protein
MLRGVNTSILNSSSMVVIVDLCLSYLSKKKCSVDTEHKKWHF